LFYIIKNRRQKEWEAKGIKEERKRKETNAEGRE
jgi:hypothetical protein